MNNSLKASSSLWGDYFVQRRVRKAIIRAYTLKFLFENWRLIPFDHYNPVEYRQISDRAQARKLALNEIMY